MDDSDSGQDIRIFTERLVIPCVLGLIILLSGIKAMVSYHQVQELKEIRKCFHYFNSGQYAKALPLFRKLRQLNPSDYRSNSYIGYCLMEEADYKGAIAEYQTLINHNNAYYDDYNNYGNCLAKIGDKLDAQKQWRIALLKIDEDIDRERGSKLLGHKDRFADMLATKHSILNELSSVNAVPSSTAKLSK